MKVQACDVRIHDDQETRVAGFKREAAESVSRDSFT